jgi:hypothetical protein
MVIAHKKLPILYEAVVRILTIKNITTRRLETLRLDLYLAMYYACIYIYGLPSGHEAYYECRSYAALLDINIQIEDLEESGYQKFITGQLVRFSPNPSFVTEIKYNNRVLPSISSNNKM